MCVYKITPMQSCTYKMQPVYYIALYTEFVIATKLNQCYGGNAKPIALPSQASTWVFSHVWSENVQTWVWCCPMGSHSIGKKCLYASDFH